MCSTKTIQLWFTTSHVCVDPSHNNLTLVTSRKTSNMPLSPESIHKHTVRTSKTKTTYGSSCQHFRNILCATDVTRFVFKARHILSLAEKYIQIYIYYIYTVYIKGHIKSKISLEQIRCSG